MKKYFLLSIILLFNSFIMAQQKKHIVEAKETLYGLSKKYQISIDELRKSNPQLKDRAPQIGETLIIPDKTFNPNPKKKDNTVPSNTSNNSSAKDIDTSKEFIYITVEPKETLYRISKKYKISIDSIKKLNPNMDEKGPKIGEVLKLYATTNKIKNQNSKDSDSTKSNAKEDNVAISKSTVNDKNENVINVVMFLPFHTETKEKNEERNIAKEFYSGAFIALDSLTNKGRKINVNLLDSGEDNKFRETLNTYDFSNTQLIIGPLFKSGIISVANKIKKIPIVSPFTSSDELDNYSNLILYDTKDQILAEKLVEEMMKKYSGEKIYILYDNDHVEVAHYVKSLLLNKKKNIEIVLTQKAEDIKPQQNLVTQEYNKIYSIIISEDNNLLTNYLNNIINWNTDQLQPISLYYSSLFDNKKYSGKLLDFGLIYSDTKYVNEYGFNEQKTINAYKKKFCNTPGKYAIVGFDVTYDILNRMDNNGILYDKYMKSEAKQLSNKYSFIRIKNNGAWANQGARIIQLLK